MGEEQGCSEKDNEGLAMPHNPANTHEEAEALKNGKLPKTPKQKKTKPGVPSNKIAKRKASRRELTMTMFSDAGGSEVILRQVGS